MPVAGTLLDTIASPSRPDSIAIVGPACSLTYADLAAATAERAGALAAAGLTERSVVLLAGTNSIDWVVTYLALRCEGHVPLLAADHDERLVDAWSPAAIVTADETGWAVTRTPGAPLHELHDELALLMSTSGSTGSPKLVRLSADNLVTNARSIAEFQQLAADDVGITSLPLRYSFGLSVLHSHLIVGASVVVTDTSVVDPCFRRLMLDHGVTNVAGVPHTYELLERAGPERLRVASLRFVAQAGGRMEPAAVESWARRAESWGADWFSMYGQTEATARIAYMPPQAVTSHPGAVGIAVPGGTLTIDPVEEAEAGAAGEVVYRGPNVMLGYATALADLGRGRTVHELRTGDLGELDPSTGFVRIVGRLARRVKPYGLRIDLDDVERHLAERGVVADVAGDDDLLVIASPGVGRDRITGALSAATGLPEARIVALDTEPPRTPSGKIDYPAMLRAAHEARPTANGRVPSDRVEAVRTVYADVLGVTDVDPSQTFVELGGDSLSYVECSTRLERVLGTVPTDWHLRPISALAAASGRRRLARVDTTVVLRAVGILAVVSTHMRLRHVPGGAHLMLAVVGFNLARFMMPIDDTRGRLRAGFRTVARVAVPTVLWTAALMVFGQYTWSTLSLVNNYVGPRSHAANHWHFWFIEVFVHLVAITTLLHAIPAVRRADRRWPYALPLALLGLTLVLRMEWADMGDWYNLRFRTHAVAWFFVLGWLVQRSATWQQRIVTTILCLVTAPGVFQNPRREYFIALGLVLLVWVKEIPVPRRAVRPVATVAAASMWILISHFMIWPPMKRWFVIEVAYGLTVLASIGVWWLATTAPRLVRERLVPAVRSRSVAITARPAIPLVQELS